MLLMLVVLLTSISIVLSGTFFEIWRSAIALTTKNYSDPRSRSASLCETSERSPAPSGRAAQARAGSASLCETAQCQALPDR